MKKIFHKTAMPVKSKKKGVTLLLAVLVSSLLLSIGLAIFNITIKELLISGSGRESQFAFYAADTGAECALYWDVIHPGFSQSVFGDTNADTLSDGLVSYWSFNEGTGSSANDAGTLNNDGLLTNMNAATDWVSGKSSNALNFDGVNDWVDIDPVVFTGPFTVSFWYNSINDGAAARMVTGGGPDDVPSAGRKFGFLNTSGRYAFLARVVDGGTGDSSIDAPIGGWHHALLRRNGLNIVDLYVDGTKHTLFSGAAQSGVFQVWGIGGSVPSTGGQMYLGDLDEMRLYDRSLTDEEAENLFNFTSSSFASPVSQGSNVSCATADISSPATGWNSATGWNVSEGSNSFTTTFDMAFDTGSCASVTVTKLKSGGGTIDSRGYNTCGGSNPRRVERAIRVTY